MTFTRSARAASKRHVLVSIDVAAFDARWAQDASFYVDAHATHTASKLRDAETFIASATTMWASEVVVDADGRVGFTDGRHRFAALRNAGARVVVVSMSKQSRTNAQQLSIATT